MKPGVDLAWTGVLPHAAAVANSVAATVGLVASPETTSTSAISGAGLKKCSPASRSGWLQRGADGGERNRRRVAAQEAVAAGDAFEIGKQRLLLRQILDDGLDDQTGAGEVGKRVHRGQPLSGSGGIGRGQPSPFGHFRELRLDAGDGAGGNIGPVVEQPDAVAGHCRDLGDPGAHRPGADDGDDRLQGQGPAHGRDTRSTRIARIAPGKADNACERSAFIGALRVGDS
jgi:hypothetical protein